jgi:hypothetical protein
MVCFAAACDVDSEDNPVIVPMTPSNSRGGTVTAFRDASVNFQDLQTFAMPDVVAHFTPATGSPLPVSRAFDGDMLDRVRSNLIARGYTPASNPQTTAPDFVVLVGATATANHAAFVSYSWFSYWGFYSGFDSFDPGFDATWGIVYPWNSAAVVSFPRGTIVVDLIPTETVQPVRKTIRSAWAGVATALLDGTLTSADVTAAIDKMFALSPYLRAD